MSNDAALYREALRMACEYFQEPLMSCPEEEDYQLVSDETHACYGCKFFSWYLDTADRAAFTEKAVKCFMKAFILRAQRKRNEEIENLKLLEDGDKSG